MPHEVDWQASLTRLAIDEEMMRQVRDISDAVAPRYTFLVVDALFDA